MVEAFLLGWWGAVGLGFPLYRYASKKLIDHPTERSSHTKPIPRGGGGTIVILSALGALLLLILGKLPVSLFGAISGGYLIALMGWVDDHRPLPIAFRLAVQILAAIWSLFWLTDWEPLTGWQALLSLLALLWATNLYNFMDGIDGLAGSQAFVWCLVLALLTESPFTPLMALTGGALLGFLLWNWPPARIFMGDVGSQFLGFFTALTFLTLGLKEPTFFWSGAILTSLFWIDATYTLCYRLMTGQKWYLPHRSHAYQKLAGRKGHFFTTTLYCLITLFWLLPWSLFIFLKKPFAIMGLALAIAPPLVFVASLRAGYSEKNSEMQ